MVGYERQATDQSVSRRRVLGALATTGTVGAGALGGCLSRYASSDQTTDEPATFLLSTALSGPYGRIGRNERRGFELAVSHLNEGGGLVDAGAFDELDGAGVLGVDVETVVLDSEGNGETARSTVQPYVDDGSATMLCGGVRASVARAHRDISVEHELPFLTGTTLLDEFSGEQCAPTVFRELYTSSALVEALDSTLATEVGEANSYFQLYADAPEGAALKDAFNGYFSGTESLDWRPLGTKAVRPGAKTLESDLERAASRRPGAVFLNLFGVDAINAVAAARDVLDDDTQIIVPLIDDSLGSVLEGDVDGLLGTLPWTASIESEYGSAFDTAYVSHYGPSTGGDAQSGSGTAHVTYVQTLQFAAAAERAGSFEPGAIQAELEGARYDVGLGPQELQACNHQADRPVPVVRGTDTRGGSGDYFELVDIADDVARGCDESPAAGCSL